MPTPARRRSEWAEWALVGFCVAAGAVYRFMPGSPMWLDEALSVNVSDGPFGAITTRLRHDGHPPLYYWLLHLWLELFGDSAAAARALSGVLGLVALALVWLVGRRYGGLPLARMSVALMAASPFAIRYASEARMYELVIVLVLAGWLLVDRALQAASVARLAPLPVVAGALLLTHYWSIFLIAVVGLGLVVHAWRAGAGPSRTTAIRLAVAVAVGGVFFVPWLSAFRYQSAHTGTPWAPASRPTRVVTDSIVDWTGGLFPEAGLLAYGLVALALLGVFGHRSGDQLVLGRPVRDWRVPVLVVLAGTVTLGSAVSLATHSAFAGRYASVYFPLFVVIAGLGLTVIGTGWFRATTLALLTALAFATATLNIVRYDRTQAGAVAAAINDEARAGDLVVVCPDQLGPALSRLVHVPGVRVVRYPDLGDPHFVDWVDYEERLDQVDPAQVASTVLAQAGAGTIWLEWSEGYRTVGEQCGELAALLIAARPGTRPVVTADGARYFEFSSLIPLHATR
ncbi:MAG TPA: glycosyltransferase family 39 protein [Acidimicrobiales bacterium]|nr:glycosyltransferase family 39 protein [Acidimicrobiales bacterium]